VRRIGIHLQTTFEMTPVAGPITPPQLANHAVLVSVVIPVYNEEDVLQALFDRLYPSLDALGEAYEIIFVNDGSRDKSAQMLAAQFHKRPDVTRVVLFNGNFGQHMAIMAGFEQVRGAMAITLDADLQNPPEEIPKLVAAIRAGHDYVGTIRKQREDSAFRRYASKAMNRLRENITRIQMTDQGCMLRAYDRALVDTLNACHEVNTFIPALAYTFAAKPTEIEVAHEERFAGESKYSLYKLIRLNFDLVTGFSIVPLQWFSLIGTFLSVASGALFLLLLARRFLFGAEVEGVFTLFALQFFLTGIILFGIGLMGEYVGRIQQEVRNRPRYRVSAVLQTVANTPVPSVVQTTSLTAPANPSPVKAKTAPAAAPVLSPQMRLPIDNDRA
jgi:undecaprenyl-phosphate 4-deoxy-4-formamido-L-arabinose transferase